MSADEPAVQRRGPHADELAKLPKAERRAKRREFRMEHERSKEEQQERYDARQARRGKREPWVRLAVWVLARLPMRVGALVGDTIGTLTYYFAGTQRRRALANLELALGNEMSVAERKRIARGSMRNLVSMTLMYPRLHHLGTERALEYLEVVGEEHLKAALELGNGAFYMSFHYGQFELTAAYVGSRYGCRAVGEKGGRQTLTERLIQMRRDLGCETIERGSARDIVKTLRKNGLVGIVADTDTDVNGVFVPFFGELALTAVGPASISVRTGAPIVMGFTEWVSRTHHRLVFHPPMTAREDLPREEAIHELTYRTTKFGEAQVRQRPDHWFWIHKRWETRPDFRPNLPVYRGPDASDGVSGAAG